MRAFKLTIAASLEFLRFILPPEQTDYETWLDEELLSGDPPSALDPANGLQDFGEIGEIPTHFRPSWGQMDEHMRRTVLDGEMTKWPSLPETIEAGDRHPSGQYGFTPMIP